MTLNAILETVKPKGEIIAAEVGGTTEQLIERKDFDKPLGFAKGALNAVGSIVLFNSTRSILDLYHQKLEFMQDVNLILSFEHFRKAANNAFLAEMAQ